MTIADERDKCKSPGSRVPRDMLVVSVLILASSASFGLGLLAGSGAGKGSEESALSAATTTCPTLVASKNGTKYYLPGCSGAERISEANKVWFVSAAAAKSAGYEPAANCAGL